MAYIILGNTVLQEGVCHLARLCIHSCLSDGVALEIQVDLSNSLFPFPSNWIPERVSLTPLNTQLLIDSCIVFHWVDADQVTAHVPSPLYSVKKKNKQTGVGWRHALEVRAWTAFAEYLSLVPSTQAEQLPSIWSGGSHMDTYTYVHSPSWTKFKIK